jgi:hypothetical protein
VRLKGPVMSEQQTQSPPYTVNISEAEGAPGAFVFTFVPKGPHQERGPNGRPKRVPQYVASVRLDDDQISFDWSGTPDDPGTAQQELEQQAQERMRARSAWARRVADLVDHVERWTKELGWATRRIEKRLEDSYIGKHQVPALLLQEDTTRALLEPVGRSAPGTEGIVDLYLMPAYDDIASLYYYENRWNLHYAFSGTGAVSTREAPARPLSKEALQEVLAEMKQHAA